MSRESRALTSPSGVLARLERLHAAELTAREQSRLLGRLAALVDDETWQAALDGVMRERAGE